MSLSTAAAGQAFSSIPSARFPKDELATGEQQATAPTVAEQVDQRRRSAGSAVVRTAERFANAGPDCFWEVSADR